jgi:hypothetical protein
LVGWLASHSIIVTQSVSQSVFSDLIAGDWKQNSQENV